MLRAIVRCVDKPNYVSIHCLMGIWIVPLVFAITKNVAMTAYIQVFVLTYLL